MNLEATVLISAGVIIFSGAVLQGAVGFGYALFATPLLVLLGIPLQSVIAIVATCSLVQSMLGAHHLREHIPWRLAFGASAIRLGAMVLGLVGLKYLVTLDPGAVRLSVGIALCLVVVLQRFWRPAPVAKVHPAWSAAAFTTSGMLSGLLGMGGPPLILWVMAHDWTPRKSRSLLFALFALGTPAQLAMMIIAFGSDILTFIATGLLAIPLVYAGTRIGVPIGNRLSRNTLRNLAYLLLFIIGISTILRS